MYQVTIKKEALKELQSLPKRTVTAISNSIEQLCDEPRPKGCKKLAGFKENIWRIRVGDYRVVYVIDDVVRIVNVRKIGHRRDVYE